MIKLVNPLTINSTAMPKFFLYLFCSFCFIAACMFLYNIMFGKVYIHSEGDTRNDIPEPDYKERSCTEIMEENYPLVKENAFSKN